MTPYYQDDAVTIWHGDCREALPDIQGVTAVVTDPPYGLSFMGKDWDHGIPGPEFWTAVAAACLPGAPLLAFGGTRTFHRLFCVIEDAGWEVRDCLSWLYGSGFPKSLDVSKAIDKAAGVERNHAEHKRIDRAGWRFETQGTPSAPPTTDAARTWDGYGTALKPAWEPICLAMKPLDETFAGNALAHGVAGLNVDGGRIPASDNVTRERAPDGGASMFGTGAGGGAVVPTSQGRWPANVIHDGSAEVLAGFPCNADPASGQVKHVGKQATTDGKYGKYAGRSAVMHNDSGSAARFFKCCPQEPLCRLCLTTPQKHDTVSGNIGEESCSNSPAQNAESPSATTQATTPSTALPSATEQVSESLVQSVRSAGNLCGLCATVIARSIVVMQHGQNPDSLLGKAFISEHKKLILTQNLALLVASLENIDTIPTIESLKLLFGSVQHAIESSTAESIMASSPRRFLYQSKASTAERNRGCDGLEAGQQDTSRRAGQKAMGEDGGGNAYNRGAKPVRNNHPTVKPLALMRYLCTLVTMPERNLILDPFSGSGTTGVACKELGLPCILIEHDEHACEIAAARIRATQRMAQETLPLTNADTQTIAHEAKTADLFAGAGTNTEDNT